ncbi:RING finger protein 39 [Crocuta crocuta]
MAWVQTLNVDPTAAPPPDHLLATRTRTRAPPGLLPQTLPAKPENLVTVRGGRVSPTETREGEDGEGCPRRKPRAHIHVLFCPSQDTRKTWRRLDAPTPKSSNSDDDVPEDYPVVKNMLHRLTGKDALSDRLCHVRSFFPQTIRVDVDWERGRVAFYDGRSLDLLFAFQAPGPLGQRVFPLLCTRDARAPLRLVPAEG